MARHRVFRIAAAAAALIALASCNRAIPPAPEQAPRTDAAPPPPQDLAGGPVSPKSKPLAGGPTSPPPPVFFQMQPIPNPSEPSVRRGSDETGKTAQRGQRPHALRQRSDQPGPAALAAVPAPRLAKLETTVSATIMRGAILTIAPQISDGAPGLVSFSLPSTLLGDLQGQAVAAGLGRKAEAIEIRAALSGPGFEIIPPGRQTLPLARGLPALLTWRAIPHQSIAGPLAVDLQAILVGDGAPLTLTLTQIQSKIVDVRPPGQVGGPESQSEPLTLPHLPGWGDRAPGAGEAAIEGAPQSQGRAQLVSFLGVIAAVVLGLVLRARMRRRPAERPTRVDHADEPPTDSAR